MANLNTAITPAPQVTVQSQSGATISSSTASVTISLAENPTGATLGGTTTVSAISGVATFNNLTLNRSGSDFRLLASGTGLRSALSEPFSIPTKLVVTSQPSLLQPDEVFTITVASKDYAGNTDARYSGFVNIEIYAANPGGGTLGGNLQRLAVNGVATFPDLTLDTEATYYLKLTALPDSGLDCYTPAAALTSQITVTDFYQLTINSATSSYDVYSEFVSQYGVPPSNAAVRLTVSGAVVVRGTPAITVGSSWTGTPIINIVNNGYIVGDGGSGGGGSGNDAMELSGETIYLENYGIVGGGGGGGGNGGSITQLNPCGSSIGVSGGAGGGGGGAPYGLGGNGSIMTPPGAICTGPVTPVFNKTNGDNGNTADLLSSGTGGSGGSISVDGCTTGGCATPSSGSGGAGGNGGGLGESGAAGSVATASPGSVSSPTAGGSPGKAINLSGGSVVYVVEGVIIGAVS